VEVTFHGVRGSIPAPGPETVRYGGNTCCVSLRSDNGKLLVLDMGTGIISLGRQLLRTEFGRGQGHGAILLSHAHWDHIQGFPFFAPVFVPGNRFSVFGPAKSASMLEGILEGQVNPHFSPLQTMKNLGAMFELVPVPTENDPPPIFWQGIAISGRPNPHGPSTCMAYRIEENGRSLVYAPDAGYPEAGPSEEVLRLYQGADLLIHDSTYTPEDRSVRLSRGYSSFADAAYAAVRAQVRRLALFHFDQDYSDDAVDQMYSRCRELLDSLGGRHIELIASREGDSVTL
jgi:phosphoribosyl 1,2-cyclic phosphodiesterase